MFQAQHRAGFWGCPWDVHFAWTGLLSFTSLDHWGHPAGPPRPRARFPEGSVDDRKCTFCHLMSRAVPVLGGDVSFHLPSAHRASRPVPGPALSVSAGRVSDLLGWCLADQRVGVQGQKVMCTPSIWPPTCSIPWREKLLLILFCERTSPSELPQVRLCPLTLPASLVFRSPKVQHSCR